MASGRYIAERDWPDWRKLLQEFRAVGRTLRRQRAAADRRTAAERWEFGRLDQAVTSGVLTDGEKMTVWLGPGHAGSDRATSTVISIDYATHDMDAGTYVTATRKRGKWYAMPWECPVEEPVE